MIQLPHPPAFQWDEGNRDKSWRKHGITCESCEEIFFDPDLLVIPDPTHSVSEDRYLAYGKNDLGEKLLVCFTLRNGLIRPISARRANRREIDKYEGPGA